MESILLCLSAVVVVSIIAGCYGYAHLQDSISRASAEIKKQTKDEFKCIYKALEPLSLGVFCETAHEMLNRHDASLLESFDLKLKAFAPLSGKMDTLANMLIDRTDLEYIQERFNTLATLIGSTYSATTPKNIAEILDIAKFIQPLAARLKGIDENTKKVCQQQDSYDQRLIAINKRNQEAFKDIMDDMKDIGSSVDQSAKKIMSISSDVELSTKKILTIETSTKGLNGCDLRIKAITDQLSVQKADLFDTTHQVEKAAKAIDNAHRGLSDTLSMLKKDMVNSIMSVNQYIHASEVKVCGTVKEEIAKPTQILESLTDSFECVSLLTPEEPKEEIKVEEFVVAPVETKKPKPAKKPANKKPKKVEKKKVKAAAKQPKKEAGHTKVTPEMIKQIQQLRGEGMGYAKIGDKLSLSSGTVYKIVNG